MMYNLGMNKMLFVWDFHGVLEKGNDYAVQKLCNLTLQSFNKDRKISIQEVRDWYGLSWFDYFKLATPEGNIELWKDMVKKVHSLQQKGWDIIKEHIKVRYFAKEVLAEIKNKGHCNILLSNTHPNHLQSFTDLIGIIEYFDDLIGVDKDNNSQTGKDFINVKSKALSDYLVGKKYSKIIVIGDSDVDIQAGKDNKAITYLFMDPNFNKQPIGINSNYVISDLRKVLQELKRIKV